MQTNNRKKDFLAEKSPIFEDALFKSTRPVLDMQKWDGVVELYEKKKYRDAVLGILDYVDAELMKKTGNEEKTRFTIPHGSIIVQVDVDDNHFSVRAPFLKIPETNCIPLLRQVTQLNFHPLNLSNIFLEDDHLVFKYDCPLELCEPFKTYDVFREICSFADFYDDEFIKKFNAKRMYEPQIELYPLAEREKAWDRVQAYLEETVAFVDYFERKRLFDFSFDMMSNTLLKIYYYISPQGMLRTEVEKVMSYFHDRDNPLMDKISRGKKFIKQLQDYDREEFINDLYTAEIFIPYRSMSTIEDIRTDFQSYYDTAKKEIDGRYFMAAVLTLQSAFLNIFYHCIIPDDIVAIINEALVKSDRKPWEEASGILWEAIEEVMNYEKPKKSKGFFRRLFGR